VRDAAMQARVERLLGGNFRPDDVGALFRHLRTHSYGLAPVREIGHFVAHPEGRDRGVVTDEVRDFVAALNVKFAPHFDPATSLQTFRRALSSTFHKLGSSFIREQTGFNRKKAFALLSSGILKIDLDDNGHLRWFDYLSVDEASVLRTCYDNIVVRPAFTADELYRDFCFVLRKNNLLSDNVKDPLAHVRPGIILYAVAAMHQVTVALDDDSKATLKADIIGGLIGVSAATPLAIDGHGSRTFVAQMFETDFRAEEWCAPELTADPSLLMSHHIEVDTNQRLAVLW
jgi:hypothetical protein